MLEQLLSADRRSWPDANHISRYQRTTIAILSAVVFGAFGCSNEPLGDRRLSALQDESSVAETPGLEHKQPTFITTSLAADNQVEAQQHEPFFEKVDVLFPGLGDTLTQAPVPRWKRDQRAVGHIYYSTGEPKTAIIHLEGMTRQEVQALAKIPVEIDFTQTRYHESDGFGIHLPGLLVTARGTVIAVCQKRHHSMADSGHRIDVMMSRSQDDGRTWQRQEVIFQEPGISAFLGPIFEDRTTGTVFVAFWKMPVGVVDDLGYFSKYAQQGGGFWLVKSTDEGQNWSDPFYVRPQPNDDGWVAWTNNCVHGIQLVSEPFAGRLVLPAFLYKEGEPGQVPGVRGGLLYSDDDGKSWRAGAVLPEGSDEVNLVETTDGGIYVTYRKNSLRTGKRHFARSADGGASFHRHGQHEDVRCRNLHAGLARFSSTRDGKENILLFSNPPGGSPAKNMTVRLSRDEGVTWPISRVIEPNPCRYSDLAVTPDGTILCLYTNGKTGDREKISVARFNLEWLQNAEEGNESEN